MDFILPSASGFIDDADAIPRQNFSSAHPRVKEESYEFNELWECWHFSILAFTIAYPNSSNFILIWSESNFGDTLMFSNRVWLWKFRNWSFNMQQSNISLSDQIKFNLITSFGTSASTDRDKELLAFLGAGNFLELEPKLRVFERLRILCSP